MSKADTQRPRLGRGLSSLISVSETPVEADVSSNRTKPGTGVPAQSGLGGDNPNVGVSGLRSPSGLMANGTVANLPIDSITVNPHQPRRSMNEQLLADLAASIKSTGVIQPILVRQTADGQVQLIAGERRWRASKLAGLREIPAIVREVDAYSQAQMALVENIQREDLNPIDRALGYRALMEQLGLTQAEVAGRMGESASSIANYLRLLMLAEPIQGMVKDGTLSLGHAKLLAVVPDAKEQQRLAQLCVSQNLSVRNLENLLTKATTPVNKRAGEVPTPLHLADLEKNIAQQLGMRVKVRPGKNKKRGSLLIHYGNLDQFDDLMSRLGVKLD